MKPLRLSSARLGVLAAIGVLALAGCGRLNRSATINQVTVTSGARTAAALQQQLAADHGLPGAHVTCAKRLIVNVGTTTSCELTGAGKYSKVRFTFSSSHGRIDTASVKTS
jgi:outer membrane murein-binding lipoprotein Lpp